MPCDSVIVSRDATRLGLMSKSDTISGSWEYFYWATGAAGITSFRADAHNPWFKESCSVVCEVMRPCSLIADLSVRGMEGSHWDIRSFLLSAGYDYDIALWQLNLPHERRPPWLIRVGKYDWGRYWWDTIMDTARLVHPGEFLRFRVPETDTYQIGWKGYPGWTGQFLIFEMPLGEDR